MLIQYKLKQTMNKKNIEVEGGELLLMSDEGHYAVIPAKYRREVMDMAKEGCDDCINSYIQSLPKESDYAEDGTLLPKTDPPNKVQLPEVTVTADKPDWLKYRDEYMSGKPFDVDKYVEDRFNNPSGRGKIDKINPEEFKTKLRNKALKYRYDEAMSYVRDKLVERTPMSKNRGEWLDSFSDKEQEILLQDPRYQSTLYQDTKRGLMSLVEQNPGQTFANILNSSDYSTNEKREMLKDYAEHPVMSKLGDAAKIFSPMSIPSKMVQSAYKDDYTLSDAIKGKKNDAGIIEDMATDLSNLVGTGLVGKLSKVDKVIDATKAGSKVLSKSDDVIKSLPKLEQTPLDFNIEDLMKGISSTDRKNITIIKEGNKYFKELDNPESLKRLKEFGDEYGIDLMTAYKKAAERWEYGTNIGKNTRFQVAGEEIFEGDIINAMGVSTLDKEGVVKNYFNKKSGIKGDLSDNSVNYINIKSDIRDYPNIVWHELSHDINKFIINSSPKLTQDISDIFVKNLDEVNKEKVLKARKIAHSLYKSDIKKSNKNLIKSDRTVEQVIEDEFYYVTRPTETWAFLSTNLRQDLKNTGIIKDYNELLTSEKLEQAIKNGNTVFSRFEPYIADKDKFIELFNKMTLSIAPAALYFQSQKNDKKKQ